MSTIKTILVLLGTFGTFAVAFLFFVITESVPALEKRWQKKQTLTLNLTGIALMVVGMVVALIFRGSLALH